MINKFLNSTSYTDIIETAIETGTVISTTEIGWLRLVAIFDYYRI